MTEKPCPWCEGKSRARLMELCEEHRAEAVAERERARTRTCVVCGTTYRGRPANWLPTGLCSDECRRAWRLQRQRERRAAARVEPEAVPCARCGSPFTPSRSDARFCSGRCRVAAHRARQATT